MKHASLIRFSGLVPIQIKRAISSKILRISAIAAQMNIKRTGLDFDLWDLHRPAESKFAEFNALMQEFDLATYAKDLPKGSTKVLGGDSSSDEGSGDLCNGIDPTILSSGLQGGMTDILISKGRKLLKESERKRQVHGQIHDQVFSKPNRRVWEGGTWIPPIHEKEAKLTTTCLSHATSRKLADSIARFVRRRPATVSAKDRLIERYLDTMASLFIPPVPVTFSNICSSLGTNLYSSYSSSLVVVDASSSKDGLPFQDGHAEMVRDAAREIRDSGLIPIAQAKPLSLHEVMAALEGNNDVSDDERGATPVLQCVLGLRSIEAYLSSHDEGLQRCFEIEVFEDPDPRECRLVIATKGIKTRKNGRSAIISTTCWCQGSDSYEDHPVCCPSFRDKMEEMELGNHPCKSMTTLELFGDGTTGHSPRVAAAIMSVKTMLPEIKMRLRYRWRSATMPGRYAADDDRYPLSAKSFHFAFHDESLFLETGNSRSSIWSERSRQISVEGAGGNEVIDDSIPSGSAVSCADEAGSVYTNASSSSLKSDL